MPSYLRYILQYPIWLLLFLATIGCQEKVVKEVTPITERVKGLAINYQVSEPAYWLYLQDRFQLAEEQVNQLIEIDSVYRADLGNKKGGQRTLFINQHHEKIDKITGIEKVYQLLAIFDKDWTYPLSKLHLTRELGLRKDQSISIETINKYYQLKINDMTEKGRKGSPADALNQERVEDILNLLDAAQKRKFQKIKRDRKITFPRDVIAFTDA